MKIPLSRPDIAAEDIDAVVNVLKTPNLSLGPKLAEFEESFASYTGSRYATAVSSGTGALHLALKALDIGEGDEVITTPFSFIASASTILFVGATPVFVDIDPEDFNLDASKLEGAITERTRAIQVVHVFGRPADMDTILEIARRHDLAVIEDSCEAIGARYRNRQVGTLGDIGVFAFYPNKQMTTGEGGMLITQRPELDELFKSLRNQGRGGKSKWLQHERLGYNYRISDINCALGISQLERIDVFLAKRKEVARKYREALEGIEEIKQPISELPDADISWFVYVIQLRDDSVYGRDDFLKYLTEQGVSCSNYFAPIHLQPCFRRLGFRKGDFPVTESVSNSTVALPFFNNLSDDEINYVANMIRKGLNEESRRRTTHPVRRSVLQRAG